MPTSKATPRTPLPYAILYSALGVILDGREHGKVKALTAAEMSRAIAIATATRQRSGHVLPGSRTLSPAGVVWQRAKKREAGPEVVAADVAEWERLVALTHRPAPKAKAKPKRNAPKARAAYALRVAWSKPHTAWHYALRHKGVVIAAGLLPRQRRDASAGALRTASLRAIASTKLDPSANIAVTVFETF